MSERSRRLAASKIPSFAPQHEVEHQVPTRVTSSSRQTQSLPGKQSPFSTNTSPPQQTHIFLDVQQDVCSTRHRNSRCRRRNRVYLPGMQILYPPTSHSSSVHHGLTVLSRPRTLVTVSLLQCVAMPIPSSFLRPLRSTKTLMAPSVSPSPSFLATVSTRTLSLALTTTETWNRASTVSKAMTIPWDNSAWTFTRTANQATSVLTGPWRLSCFYRNIHLFSTALTPIW